MGTDKEEILHIDQEVPFYWTDHTLGQHLNISILQKEGEGNSAFTWSGAFPISAAGEFTVKLRNRASKREMYIPISIALKEAMLIVSFMRQNQDELPYKLENYTKYTIDFIQVKGQNSSAEFIVEHLRPAKFRNNTTIPESKYYTWDEEISPPRLKVMVGDLEREYYMDERQVHPPIRVDETNLTTKVKTLYKKKGQLYVKKHRLYPYRKRYFYLSERWLCYGANSSSTKMTFINLELDCTKISDRKNLLFEVLTCNDNYFFKAIDEDDALSWHEEILESINASNEINFSKMIYVDVDFSGLSRTLRFKNWDD